MKKSISETVAKDIILEELSENTHLVMVEDVIFWALEHYINTYDTGHPTQGKVVASCIVSRIKDEEKTTIDRKRWSREQQMFS